MAGRPLDPVYKSENLELLEKGCGTLLAHIDIVKRSGIRPVVCLNQFHTDTAAEHALVRMIAEAAGARFAVSSHWLKGGAGAVELAEQVIAACEEPNQFAFLSSLDQPISTRIETIVQEVYGGEGVTFSDEAKRKLALYESDPATARLPVCMAKTQYSLSHDPKLVGRPKGWTLPVRDILLYQGAGFVVPVAGDIKLMPGTASNPAFRNVDIDTVTGKVKGLF
jgi:formate--tetrahydrofolate ligase